MGKKIKVFFLTHEYMIFSVAAVFLVLMWLIDRNVENFDMIKPESLSKIAFAIIVVSIIGGCAWVWMNVVPYFKNKINPDMDTKEVDISKLGEWQKVVVILWERFQSFLWYALYFAAGITAVGLF